VYKNKIKIYALAQARKMIRLLTAPTQQQCYDENVKMPSKFNEMVTLKII
jgi:hypothetical protein